MSPAEYIELIQTARSDVASFVMNYVTILFAFLTMTYLVGSKLSVAQLVIIVSLYTIFAYYLLGTVTVTYEVMYKMMADFSEAHPDIASNFYEGRGKGKSQVSIIMLSAWVVSILFLVFTKWGKAGDGSSDINA